MEYGESIEIIENLLYITSHRNRGAAWGILQGQMWFFYIITIAVIIGLVYYIQKMAKESILLGVALALMLGGAIGNFIDRVARQEVVDFVHTYIFSYSFPVFNVADAALSIGVGLLVIHMFLEEKTLRRKIMDKRLYSIDETLKGVRIDKALSTLNEEWSRTQVQQWIKDDHVLVNGTAIKTNYKAIPGDTIEVTIPDLEELDAVAEEMDLDIYYEDKDVLVVNKPSGMVVHPAPGHVSGTLVNGLMAHCKDLSGINGVMRPGIVHRIDKDTSGLLMVAKNDMAHEKLVQQLVDKTVTRKYQAVVHGVIPHDFGTIDAPIGRDKKDRQSMTVTDSNSKNAVTHFRVIERFKAFTLVECQLETGRTHQIRVHMKYIGFPLAGDPKYGPKKTLKLDGQALHAGLLGFIHPRTNEYMEFEAPIPEEFENLINQLRRSKD